MLTEKDSEGSEFHMVVIPPGDKVGLDHIHGERIEHARALFVQDLKSLKLKSVEDVMEKWGVALFPHYIGDFYSSIAYSEDYPKEKRLHESELRKHN